MHIMSLSNKPSQRVVLDPGDRLSSARNRPRPGHGPPPQQSPIHNRGPSHGPPAQNRGPPQNDPNRGNIQKQNQNFDDGFNQGSNYPDDGYQDEYNQPRDQWSNQPQSHGGRGPPNRGSGPPAQNRNPSQEDDFGHKGQPQTQRRPSDNFGNQNRLGPPGEQSGPGGRSGPGGQSGGMNQRPSSISPKPLSDNHRSSPMSNSYSQNNSSSNEYQSGPNNSYQSNYQNRKMGPTNRGPIGGSNQGRQMGGPVSNINRGPPGGPNRGGPPTSSDGPSGPMGGHQRMNRGAISSEEKWDSAMSGGPSNLGPPKGPNQNQGNRGNFHRGPPSNTQSQMINQDQSNPPRRYSNNPPSQMMSDGPNSRSGPGPKMGPSDPKMSPLTPRQTPNKGPPEQHINSSNQDQSGVIRGQNQQFQGQDRYQNGPNQGQMKSSNQRGPPMSQSGVQMGPMRQSKGPPVSSQGAPGSGHPMQTQNQQRIGQAQSGQQHSNSDPKRNDGLDELFSDNFLDLPSNENMFDSRSNQGQVAKGQMNRIQQQQQQLPPQQSRSMGPGPPVPSPGPTPSPLGSGPSPQAPSPLQPSSTPPLSNNQNATKKTASIPSWFSMSMSNSMSSNSNQSEAPKSTTAPPSNIQNIKAEPTFPIGGPTSQSGQLPSSQAPPSNPNQVPDYFSKTSYSSTNQNLGKVDAPKPIQTGVSGSSSFGSSQSIMTSSIVTSSTASSLPSSTFSGHQPPHSGLGQSGLGSGLLPSSSHLPSSSQSPSSNAPGLGLTNQPPNRGIIASNPHQKLFSNSSGLAPNTSAISSTLSGAPSGHSVISNNLKSGQPAHLQGGGVGLSGGQGIGGPNQSVYNLGLGQSTGQTKPDVHIHQPKPTQTENSALSFLSQKTSSSSTTTPLSSQSAGAPAPPPPGGASSFFSSKPSNPFHFNNDSSDKLKQPTQTKPPTQPTITSSHVPPPPPKLDPPTPLSGAKLETKLKQKPDLKKPEQPNPFLSGAGITGPGAGLLGPPGQTQPQNPLTPDWNAIMKMGMTDPAMIEKLLPGGLNQLSALGALNPTALNPSSWNSALNQGIIQSAGNLPGAHPYPQDLLIGQKDGQKQPANQKPSIVSAPAAHAGSSLLSSLSSNQKPSAEIPKLTPKTTPTPKSIPKLSPHQPTIKPGGLVPPNLTGVGLEDKNDDRSITELLSKSNASAATSNLTSSGVTSSGVTSSPSTLQGQNNFNLSQTKKTPDGKKNEFKHFKKRIQSEFNKTPLLNEIIKGPSPTNKSVLPPSVTPTKSQHAAKLPTPTPTPPTATTQTTALAVSKSNNIDFNTTIPKVSKVEKTKIKKRSKKKKDRKEKIEKIKQDVLPPDPGYIPKVRITTFRSLTGTALHQSNQFKPGEERTRARLTRRRENFETKKVDLSEMIDWEKGHIDRKRKRNREKLGLPVDDYENNNLSSVGEKTKSHEEDHKRRQEAYEREPVELEDEPRDQPRDENHDFSQLIDQKAPVPRYHPINPPKRLFLDDMLHNTHSCLECGDEFMFESSLKAHYERTSIIIEINCMICKGKMIFYNRCQLLRHAREHTQNNEPMKFASPTIQPISLNSLKPRVTPPNLNTSCAKECTECSMKFATRIGLQEHMQRTNSSTEGLTCEPCGMTLPNRCSYMAHTRIHTETGNQVCPDCGENFGDRMADFNKHIKLHCFHTSRITGYRCPLSGKVFARLDYLVSHIHNNLLIRFFKCAECPVAFRSQNKIMIHTKENHPKMAMLYRSIYKCPLCKTVFHDKEQANIPKHIHEHVKNCTAVCYHCLICPEVFESKAELAEHLSTDHLISEHKTSAEDLQAALQAQQTLNGRRTISSDGSHVSEKMNGASKNDLMSDNSFDSDDSSFSDTGDNRTASGRRRKNSKSRTHPKFRHKGAESESARNSRTKSTANGNTGPKKEAKMRLNCCKLCDFTSPKPSAVQKHLHKVHHIDYVTSDMIKTKITQNSISTNSTNVSNLTSTHNEDVPASTNALPTTGRPVLMTPKGPISMRNMRKEPTQEELAREDPPLPESYTCQKCEFTHRSRQEFQKHIKKHLKEQEKGDSFQCTECGNCFCSLKSLENHLYMSHKVRSVLQLDRIDKDFRGPLAPKKKETDFTFSCNTCSKTFASKDVLAQHMKSHGLAFIKGLK